MKIQPPSYWSGLAAPAIPFEDVEDYSRWACLLLEEGYEGEGINTLASMGDESNLFVIRGWHCKALIDLGLEPLEGVDALMAHARGVIEEYFSGRRDYKDLIQTLHDSYLDSNDSRLEPFYTLNCAWWTLTEVDYGFSSMEEIEAKAKEEGKYFLEKQQAEQVAAPDS